MKEITMYVAYDGTKFASKEACERYEEPIEKLIYEATKIYTFYDATLKCIWFKDYPHIERFFDWLNELADICKYIYVNKLPSEELDTFLNSKYNYHLPVKETGLHHYELNKKEWVRC